LQLIELSMYGQCWTALDVWTSYSSFILDRTCYVNLVFFLLERLSLPDVMRRGVQEARQLVRVRSVSTIAVLAEATRDR